MRKCIIVFAALVLAVSALTKAVKNDAISCTLGLELELIVSSSSPPSNTPFVGLELGSNSVFPLGQIGQNSLYVQYSYLNDGSQVALYSANKEFDSTAPSTTNYTYVAIVFDVATGDFVGNVECGETIDNLNGGTPMSAIVVDSEKLNEPATCMLVQCTGESIVYCRVNDMMTGVQYIDTNTIDFAQGGNGANTSVYAIVDVLARGIREQDANGANWMTMVVTTDLVTQYSSTAYFSGYEPHTGFDEDTYLYVQEDGVMANFLVVSSHKNSAADAGSSSSSSIVNPPINTAELAIYNIADVRKNGTMELVGTYVIAAGGRGGVGSAMNDGWNWYIVSNTVAGAQITVVPNNGTATITYGPYQLPQEDTTNDGEVKTFATSIWCSAAN